MIKTSIKILLPLLLLSSIFSCRKPPEYPLGPVIYNGSENTDTTVGALRSIIVNIGYTDGDGNIGLEDIDTLDPFHPYNIITDQSGNRVFIDSSEIFNIYTHTIEDFDNDGDLDTFRITPNIYTNNILFDFVRVDGFGDIIDTLDFSKLGPIGIDPLNARIEPLYKKDFSQEIYEGPIDGTIQYEISSSFLLLPKGTYKILVTIVDRDLNVSNTVTTSPAFIKK